MYLWLQRVREIWMILPLDGKKKSQQFKRSFRDGDSTREHGSHFDLAQLVERNPMHASG